MITDHLKKLTEVKHFIETFRFITQTIINLIQIESDNGLSNKPKRLNNYLNKIDNGLSNKPKRLNKMFNSILALNDV